MSLALGALEAWMSSNRLRLNPSKTQFIWLGTRQQLAKLDLSTIAADFPQFVFSSVVRDLGVTLDQELTFAPHINRLCRNSYYQLRQFRTVARSLTSDSTATLIHFLITVRLDYCCSLYAGLPACRLGCLNRVLRSAARLCERIPKCGHVSGYAGCASLAPSTAANLVSDHRLGLAVLAGPSPCLSTRPLLPYLGCSGSSLSPLY